MTTDTDVVHEIRRVLEHAAKGKGTHTHYVTAYQILDRLPRQMRADLIAQFGKSGAGVGDWQSAAKHIANLIKGMGGVDVDYLDTRGAQFRMADEWREAGYEVCGLYRLSRP